jgi:hypothetical protein
MERHADLKRLYKEMPKRAGIFQVKNLKSGKVLLGSTKNLHGPLNRHRFMLSNGLHPNAALQEDWKELGPEAFAFEVLEEVEMSDDPDFSVEDALVELEKAWVAKLRPTGEGGYNRSLSIRD